MRAPLCGDTRHLDLLANSRFAACRNERVNELLQNHANRANRVVVSGDWIINQLWVGISVHNGADRNLEASRLIYRLLFEPSTDADQQDFPAAARHFLKKLRRATQLQNGLIQIDDVNLVPLLEDVRLHLRVPTLSLVPEMNARFKKLRH